MKNSYRDCRKSTGNKLGYSYTSMCTCAITVPHEEWMHKPPITLGTINFDPSPYNEHNDIIVGAC